MAEQYLRRHAEEIPGWLANFKEGDRFPRDAFFRSRVGYYPGAGSDGSMVRLFNRTHACHCFAYVDYHVSRERIDAWLADPGQAFLGYDPVISAHVAEQEITPAGWRPRVPPRAIPRPILGIAPPFGMLKIFQRQPGLGDEHGAYRFAGLFLAADGFAAYEALFCQPPRPMAPFAVTIQDHGFGGNWEEFGRGGHLERISRELGVHPKFLWSAEREESWEGYSRIPGTQAVQGGMHGHPRYLYGRDA